MPQLDGVLETSLYVNDLERSVHFYQKIFGFEVIDAGERLYALAVHGPANPALVQEGGIRRPDIGSP